MKVLQITTSSKGGAGIAALRLHQALRDAGVSSAYLSKDLTIDFNGNEIADDFFAYHAPSFLTKVLRKLSRMFGLSQKTEQPITAAMDIDAEMISEPFSDYLLHKHPLVKEATILNLHWVGLILDYPTFFQQIKKPIVWTLHDMNPFSGLFHYKGDTLSATSTLSAIDVKITAQKKEVIKISSVRAIISPSNWLLEEAKKSLFFPSQCIFKTIANSINIRAIDPTLFSDFRKKHQIPQNALVFLVVAYDLKSRRKGMDLLIGAIEELENIPITIVTVGKGVLEFSKENCTIVPLGVIDTPEEMRKCYAAADAFILPSREDNLPNVMLESFAVGTPVISFAHGGMLEHIKEGETGVLATALSKTGLKDAIVDFVHQKTSYKTEKIKEYASQHFSPKQQASRYLAIYNEVASISLSK